MNTLITTRNSIITTRYTTQRNRETLKRRPKRMTSLRAKIRKRNNLRKSHLTRQTTQEKSTNPRRSHQVAASLESPGNRGLKCLDLSQEAAKTKVQTINTPKTLSIFLSMAALKILKVGRVEGEERENKGDKQENPNQSTLVGSNMDRMDGSSTKLT